MYTTHYVYLLSLTQLKLDLGKQVMKWEGVASNVDTPTSPFARTSCVLYHGIYLICTSLLNLYFYSAMFLVGVESVGYWRPPGVMHC